MASVVAHETVARELHGSLAAGDIDAALSCLDPDVEWELVGPPEIPHFGHYTGRDQVQGFFDLLGTTVEVRAFEVHSVTGTDVGAVAQGFERGCFKANGRCYDMRWCQVMVMQEGRILRFTAYADTAPMLAAWQG